jgi:hypothetical protein
VARQSVARRGKARIPTNSILAGASPARWFGTARPGKVRHGTARQGARYGVVRYGNARPGSVWQEQGRELGSARHGLVWQGSARLGLARQRLAGQGREHGQAGLGSARQRWAWQVTWHGLARPGWARHGEARESP